MNREQFHTYRLEWRGAVKDALYAGEPQRGISEEWCPADREGKYRWMRQRQEMLREKRKR